MWWRNLLKIYRTLICFKEKLNFCQKWLRKLAAPSQPIKYIKPKQKVVFPPAFSHAKAVCKFSLSESVLISSLQNGDFKKIQNESTTSDWFADSRGSCYFYHLRRHLYAPFPDCVPEGHALQSVCPVLSWNVPSAHASQEPFLSYVPGGHSSVTICKK